MFAFFRKPKIFKSVIATLAQLTILVILLPFIAILLKLLPIDLAVSFISETLAEIPVINTFTELYKSFDIGSRLNYFSLFEYIVNAITSTMISSYIVGLTVYISKKLGELIKIRGAAVFQTIIGIFVSCLFLKWLGNDTEKSIFFTCILIVVAYIAGVIVRKSTIIKFLIESTFETAITTITAATVCAYLTMLVLIINGWFSDLYTMIIMAIYAMIPALICLLVEYLLFGRKD